MGTVSDEMVRFAEKTCNRSIAGRHVTGASSTAGNSTASLWKITSVWGAFDDTAATVSLEGGYGLGYFSSISALSTTVLILPGDELVWTSPYQPGCNVLLLSLAISSSEQLTFMLSITFLDNWTMLGFVSCSAKIVFSATLRGTVALVIVMKANLLRVFFKSGIWAAGSD